MVSTFRDLLRGVMRDIVIPARFFLKFFGQYFKIKINLFLPIMLPRRCGEVASVFVVRVRSTHRALVPPPHQQTPAESHRAIETKRNETIGALGVLAQSEEQHLATATSGTCEGGMAISSYAVVHGSNLQREREAHGQASTGLKNNQLHNTCREWNGRERERVAQRGSWGSRRWKVMACGCPCGTRITKQ